MPEHDQVKWNSTIGSLTDGWKLKYQGLDAAKSNQHTPSSVDPSRRPIVSPSFMDEISTASHPSHHTDHPAPITSGELEHELGRMQQRQKEQQALSYERQRYQAADRSPATSQSLYTLTPNLTFHTLHTPSLDGQMGSLQNSMPSQLLDYDAILDELGSIDCADGIDVDPQFMTNLGFAPGCDLGEMFQGDFGT